jgi:hypothetical protein
LGVRPCWSDGVDETYRVVDLLINARHTV